MSSKELACGASDQGRNQTSGHSDAEKKEAIDDQSDSRAEPDSLDLTYHIDTDHHLSVIIADQRWAAYVDTALEADCGQLVRFVSALLETSGFTACVRLTDDHEMQALNGQFRDQDKATNVLSFPDGSADDDGLLRLGDLAFGFETMAREADQMEISIAAHIRHLIIHGLLHLIGFDHMDEAEAEEMEALEIAALTVIGVASPYQTELLGKGV